MKHALIIAGGYVLAAAGAVTAVMLVQAMTSPADAQASGGMLAFGDAIAFCLVFAALATVPTGYAIYLMFRPRRGSRREQEVRS